MNILPWLTRFAYLLAALVALAVLASGPLYRLEWLDLGSVFQMLRLAVYGGAAALALLLIGRLGKAAGNTAWLVMAALIALLYLPVQQAMVARSVPPIHDISTDTTYPPQFSDTMKQAREGARNPPEYPGEETAVQQHEAYPDIRTLTLEATPGEVYSRARELILDRGWELVNEDVTRGILEASVTTPWFGFVDDVVIRIRGNANRTSIDMRSKSRIGRSDIGANARRIRGFLDDLQQHLEH